MKCFHTHVYHFITVNDFPSSFYHFKQILGTIQSYRDFHIVNCWTRAHLLYLSQPNGIPTFWYYLACSVGVKSDSQSILKTISVVIPLTSLLYTGAHIPVLSAWGHVGFCAPVAWITCLCCFRHFLNFVAEDCLTFLSMQWEENWYRILYCDGFNKILYKGIRLGLSS